MGSVSSFSQWTVFGLFAWVLALTACDGDRGSSKGLVYNPVPPSNPSRPAFDKAICQTGAGQDPGIIGGTKASVESWLACGTIAVITDGSFCTGSLIDSKTILTAAHCVDENGDASKTFVYYSTDPLCDYVINKEMHRKAGVRRVIIHPEYRNLDKYNRVDLALIRLDRPAPYPYKSLNLVSAGQPLTPSTRILLAGYGKSTDYNAQSSSDPHDLKFTRVSPFVDDIDPTSTKSLRQMDTASQLYFDQRYGSGACAGDSGGPAFLKNARGEWEVIGVASRVDPLNGPAYT